MSAPMSTALPTAVQNKRVIVHGGASLVKYPPVFSPDSKQLLCCCGHIVKVYSVASGECASKLVGHQGIVTSVHINPENQFQAFTSSRDKTVIKWDYSDGIKLKTYTFKHPLEYILPVGHGKNISLACVQIAPDIYDLLVCKFTSQTSGKVESESLVERIQPYVEFVSIGGRGSYVALLQKGVTNPYTTLTVCSLEKKHKTVNFPQKKLKATCVACHPEQHCIAIGLASGSIQLWYDFFGEKTATSELHWHALPVETLCFSTAGSYLLSGGKECVLVKWELRSHYKEVLPRLGSQILKLVVSQDNTLYASCHADNSIQIISSNFKVVQILQGLCQAQKDKHRQDPVPTGLLLDPRTKALVLNGRPGHLQFYSMHTDRQLYNLDIVAQNYISPENIQRPLVYTEVEKAAFDQAGNWLATVERRDDHVTSLEMNLKFWKFDETIQSFTLNTSVFLPHSDKVMAMKFRPNSPEPSMVTSSRDGKFKLWTLVDDTDIYRENKCWSCESVGYYRNQAAGDADFSGDGSVLSVAFDAALTLWDPESNALKGVLMHQVDSGKLRFVKFGHGRCAHLLIAASEKRLTSWNLLTSAVHWSVATSVTALTADPSSEYMAAFTEDHSLYIFKPSSSRPEYQYEQICLEPVISAIFIPHQEDSLEHAHSQLYFMSATQMLMTFQDKGQEQEEAILDKDYELNQPQIQNLPETPFSILMSQHRERQAVATEMLQGQRGQPGAKQVQQLLSTPAHVLPPVSSLCQDFLNSLMLGKDEAQQAKEKDSDSESEKEEDSSDSDSEMDVDGEDSETKTSKDQTEVETEQQITDSGAEAPTNNKSKEDTKFTLRELKWLTDVL